MRILRPALVAGAFLLGCAGPSYKLNLKPYQLDATDFTYPSGLRVIFQEDHSQPSVMVASVVDVGSAAEPPGREGMAHLIEHLCFRAVHGDKPKVWDHMKQLGVGFFNASTYLDWTDYYSLVPKDNWEEMLEVEIQRMVNPLEGVTQADLDAEREIVRNELRLRIENGGPSKAFLLANELLYPKDHPYHRSTIGSHASLDNITMADVKAYVDEHYVPSKFTVVVSGDIDRSKASAIMARMAGKYGGKIMLPPGAKDQKVTLVEPKPRVSGPAAEPPKPVDQSVKRIKAQVSNSIVVLAWSLPGGYRENQPLMEVTAFMMGNAIGSLLYPDDARQVSTDKVESIGCSADPNVHGTTVYCFVELVEGQDAEKIVKKAVDGLWEMWSAEAEEGIEFGIGDDRVKLPGQRKLFEVAKSQYQASIFRNSASLYRTRDVAHYAHFRGRADMFSSTIRDVNAISSFDARNLAHKYLNRDRVVRLIVEPIEEKDRKTASVAADASAAWAGATAEGSASGLEDFAKITPAQIAALAVTPSKDQFRELTLENGLRVVLKRHGSAPFVKVGLYTFGGIGTVTPRGYPMFTYPTYESQDPGKIAATWSGFGGTDGEFEGVEAPSGNLEAALDLVHDRVTSTRSTWTKRRFDRTKARVKRRIKTEEGRPDIWASRALWNLAMPGHPFGKSDYDWDALDKLSASDFENWYKQSLAPKNAVLFVVGDIQLDETETKVRAMWSGWRKDAPGTRQPGYPPPPAHPKRQIALVDNPDGTQSNITLACHLKAPTVENQATRDVLVSILQEDLWSAIRERAGASYGVGVGNIDDKSGIDLLFISSAVQNDKMQPALKTMLDRIGEIRRGKLDPVKLTAAKWKIASGTRSENQTVDEMLFTMVDWVKNDVTMDAVSSYPQQLANVTVKDLQDLLEPCAGGEVVSVVGPERIIRKPLEKLNIPLETVDWRKGAGATPEVKTEASAPSR